MRMRRRSGEKHKETTKETRGGRRDTPYTHHEVKRRPPQRDFWREFIGGFYGASILSDYWTHRKLIAYI